MEESYPIIDVHCHVLPGIDDGAKTIEESVRLLEMAAEQGVVAAIATPHWHRGKKIHDLEELAEPLRAQMQEKFPDFRLYIGNETFYHEELPGELNEKKAKTLVDSQYVLVEFDPKVPYGYLFRGIRRLIDEGYIPILAHFERYACLRENKNLLDLRGCGCLLQMNYDSLKGTWFQTDTRWCRKQILDNRVFLLGTDMHRLDFRPPDIKGPLKWLEGHVDSSVLRKLVYENPMKILQYNKNS